MRRWPALVGACAVLWLVLALIAAEPDRDQARGVAATSYSAAKNGTRALLLLLRALKIPAAPTRQPGYGDVREGAVLWSLSPEPLTTTGKRELLALVQRGGCVVLPAAQAAALLTAGGGAEVRTESAQGEVHALLGEQPVVGLRFDPGPLPLALGGVTPQVRFAEVGGRPVVAGYRVGAGQVVSLGIDDITRNGRIGLADHGPFLVRLAAALGARHVFDEVRTGFGDVSLGALLWRVPYRFGLLQLGAALLALLWALAPRRFPVEASGPIRRGSTMEHVEAVAALWRKAFATGLPLQALLRTLEERARARLLGAELDGPAFPAWVQRVRPVLGQRAEQVWAEAQQVAALKRPDVEQARRLAQALHTIEEEALHWRRAS